MILGIPIIGIQIIGILFGLFMLYLVFLKIKREEFTVKETVFWGLCWLLFLFITIFPTSMDFLSWKVLSLSRTMDLVIILGFIFLAGVVFYSYTLIRQAQRQIDAVVRNIAIEQAAHKDRQEKQRMQQHP